MRPRVFPAEDLLSGGGAPGRPGASMRPRVFPAEDTIAQRTGETGKALASMRPRVFPAEDDSAGIAWDRWIGLQ